MKFVKKIVGFATGAFYVFGALNASTVIHELAQQIAPAFEKRNFPIVFASDENYAMYLGVTIQSLIDNSSDQNNYDILVLDSGISDGNKEGIVGLIKGRKNFSIRFFDMSKIVEEHKDKLHPQGYWSVAAYYRLFIPQIFNVYSKMLYLDCDLIINEDVAKLFEENLAGNLVGASKCYHICPGKDRPCRWRDYCEGILMLDDHDNYFNSGVLLLNIKKMLESNFTEKCLSVKIDHKKLQFPDEGLLNIVCEGKVLFIDERWNVPWHWNLPQSKFKAANEPWFWTYQERSIHPYIIHYTTEQKPWNSRACEPGMNIWWYHARKTPFYKKLVEQSKNRHKQPSNVEGRPH
ncbi:MAG: glycosyltransferase family 8 protein [Holosporales bacterium]|nr:glycosyltransferase family 8 protein [Holosporales bacterium]